MTFDTFSYIAEVRQIDPDMAQGGFFWHWERGGIRPRYARIPMDLFAGLHGTKKGQRCYYETKTEALQDLYAVVIEMSELLKVDPRDYMAERWN